MELGDGIYFLMAMRFETLPTFSKTFSEGYLTLYKGVVAEADMQQYRFLAMVRRLGLLGSSTRM
jgi:hypothetical protein